MFFRGLFSGQQGYKGIYIDVSDLLSGRDYRIRNRALEGCVVLGPATLIESAGLLAGNVFVGDPDEILVEQGNEAIHIDNSTFMQCEFQNIRVLVADKEEAKKRLLTRAISLE